MFIVILLAILLVLLLLLILGKKSNRHHHKIDLVIARYNESLDWLYDIDTSNINVIVYNKNDQDFSHPKVDKVIKLENVGKCDHTYLYHIIENYDNLNDVTIFTAGSCDMPYKWEQFKKVFDKATSTYDSAFEVGYQHDIRNSLYDFVLDEWKTSNDINRSKNSEVKTQLCSIRPFGKWYESKFRDLVTNYVTYMGMFAVSRKDIHNRSKEFYKDLINDVMTSNPECGHFIERSWIAIFQPSLD